MKRVIFFLFFSFTACNENWVGYSSSLFPRTHSLQGVIDKNFIKQYLPENPVIIEAGACDGLDTIEMASEWPNCKIYAFEPVPFLFSRLAERVRECKNVSVFQVALSDKSGFADFYISSGRSHGGSSSLFQPKEHLIDHPEIIFSEKIQVKTQTLDQFAHENNIQKIDFLWLDMQGAESLMLRASPEILKTVKLILTEVNITEQYANCELYDSYKKWLESIGFEAVREDLPWKNGGNVLFVRK